MEASEFNGKISALAETWCDRREYGALAELLPAWMGNNGLTDGWQELSKALRHLAGERQLPDSERETLKKLWVVLDSQLSRNAPA
jgi:hypothetical protein